MTPRPPLRVFAPAKINLALHVTGQRADGYHLLDSLVAFASVGDWLELRPGSLSMTIAGPEAGGLQSDASNLVTRTAAAFWRGGPLGLHLEKHLPISSGIGGGSADAAACYRGIVALQGAGEDAAALLALGADVPMCALSQPARVSGIGEVVEPVALPALPVLLVNPRVEVPTPAVFKTLTCKDNPPMTPLPETLTAASLTAWLKDQRNDLHPPAEKIAPVIGTVLAAITALQGCTLARMSGSGATCFGIFGSDDEANHAATTLREKHPHWWITAARLDGHTSTKPQLIRATT